MKKTYSLMLVGVMAFVPITRAVDRIVTTTTGTGAGSLTSAIGALADGDTIKFNIAGAGVKYIATPAGGYPFITNNNITFDGYSQPGSSPNTQGIHQPNNAQIKIVLDSRNGAGRPMGGPEGTTTLTDTSVWGEVTDSGWGDTEVAILPLYRGTNITIKGLGFLAAHGSSEPAGGTMKCICIATDTKSALDTEVFAGSGSGWQVSGCWFGVDPATGQAYIDLNASTEDTTMALATYGSKQAGAANTVYAVNGTIGVAKNSTNPRAEFNVIVAGYGCDLQGRGHRYSGNFANVLPDGMHNVDWFQVDGGAQEGDGDFECGGNGVANLTIGTDSDGVNDAEEGNIFGGSLSRGWVNVHMYSGPRTNIVFAGNYVGVAIDGVTRFTNSSRLIRLNTSTATGRVGSDFDGVGDSLEANLIFNNFPFDTAYPLPESEPPNTPVLVLDPGARVSLRGNKTVGNNLIPYNYANAGAALAGFTNYAAPFMDVNSANGIIPILATTNIFPRLTGTFAPGIAPYTTVVMDVYELDPEGWANGKRFLAQELTDNATFTNGFAQGMKYLGSFTVPNTGNFDITLPAYAGVVTLTANYSADPAGTKNGRVHTSNFSNPGYVLPGGADSVGLTRIVPDTIVWFDSTTSSPKVGGFVAANQTAQGGSTEATAAVLGDSTFLLAAATYADDGVSMRFTSIYQPAAGGAPKLGDLFYADSGVPYINKINESRQDGNPSQVAGDTRYGAVNFIGAGEVSLWAYPTFFNSDGRFSTTLPFYADMSGANSRDACVQTFSLSPATLSQTMLGKAQDAAFSAVTGSAPVNAGGNQQSRTGGTVAGLDNGNFVGAFEDRSKLRNPNGNASVAVIIAPNGSIVKPAFKVADADQWANVGAFKGGFYVRPSGGKLYFYDNAGNLQGSLDHNATSGIAFDTGRGDGTRTASDIRSHYVFMAGNTGNQTWLAVFDANTRTFVTKALVSDTDPARQNVDRVNVACDALNRVCVTFRLKPDTTAFLNSQVAARVLSFDGANLSYLTHSFFPFINHDSVPDVNNFVTQESSVAMTTRQIFIYAEGTVNGANDPNQPANTAAQTHLYTVLSHPAPVAAPRPVLNMTTAGSNLNLSWNPDDGLFTVQTRSSLTSGDWANATAGNVATPVSVPTGTGPLFVRLVR